jgi:hypothetical protein
MPNFCTVLRLKIGRGFQYNEKKMARDAKYRAFAQG